MDTITAISLEQVDPVLRSIVLEAMEVSSVPFRVVSGHRGRREQNALFASGLSVHRFPQSPHNQLPSRAIDVEPYADTTDLAARATVVEALRNAAALRGASLFWRGGNSPHVEMI